MHVIGAYRTELIQRGAQWPGLPYKGMMRSSNYLASSSAYHPLICLPIRWPLHGYHGQRP